MEGERMFAPYYAFFDVDETLITGKALFMFADYCFKNLSSADVDRRREAIAALHASEHSGDISGSAAVREYYRRFLEGLHVSEVVRLGEQWFTESRVSPNFFVPSVLAHAKLHQTRGGRVVLVSDAFQAPLAPLARFVGATQLLSTRVGVQRGSFTGEVLEDCTGAEKGNLVRRFLSATSVDPSQCYAYGHHLADVEMLASVGYPIVVGNDQGLMREAAKRSWSTISSAALVLE
jgi:HAD superfamily hydrolase (TIGR01490 family)